MVSIKSVPIIGKFLMVLGAFGALALASVVYSTSRMQSIDDGYSAAFGQQALGAIDVMRANGSMSRARAAIGTLVMSTTDDGDKRANDSLQNAKAKFVMFLNRAKAEDPAIAEEAEAYLDRGVTIIEKTCGRAIELGSSSAPDAVAEARALYLNECSPASDAFNTDLTGLSQRLEGRVHSINEALSSDTRRTIVTTYVSVIGGLLFILVAGYFAIRAWVSRPIKNLVGTMEALAAGDLSVAVAGTERGDEIGPMARAVQVFKDNGLKLKASEADAAAHRQAAERERAANEAAREEVARQQQMVVATIAAGLDRLSHGDLTGRLNQAFSTEYEKLRADFNATAESLQEALRTIVRATDGISSGSDEIASASDDLSRRTEQQAASLEETAAAINQITATVKKMASGAGEAASVVATARGEAEASGAIVGKAVDAMGRIKESSNQISQIIGVIDEIAFQTNLLALNAGVEAARAGDAGRGFAVVASEVRGLAQRSAEAAKEIKALIAASTVEVDSGVDLVAKTGDALQGIITKVAAMDKLVREISAQSQEQATSLAEVNTAVTQMDQVVQQNAAMVEESTAAAHALKNETQDLTRIVGRFQIDGDAQAGRAPGNPVHAAQVKLASAMRR